MKPKTRLDNFLAKIAGDPEADTSMEPKSREEHYLNKIAENSGSGSGGASNAFTMTLTPVNSDSMSAFTVDKTYAEIRQAVSNNSPLIIVMKYGDKSIVTSAVSAVNIDSKEVDIDFVINDYAQLGVAPMSSRRFSTYVREQSGTAYVYARSSNMLYAEPGKTEMYYLPVIRSANGIESQYSPQFVKDALDSVKKNSPVVNMANIIVVIQLDDRVNSYNINIPANTNKDLSDIVGTYWRGNDLYKIELTPDYNDEMVGSEMAPYVVTEAKYTLTPAT